MSSMEMRRLAAEIAGIKQEMRGASTTQQLAYSSIQDGGQIKVFDSNGKETMTIGASPDGSYGSNVRIGPTPPTPSDPIMIPTPSGMTVRWDGTWTDSLYSPDDFTRVEVHLSNDSTMTAEDASNLVGSIESPRGGDVVVTKLSPKTTYYARLVARNTAGGRGPASNMSTAKSLAPLDGPGTQQAMDDAARAQANATRAAEAAERARLAADAANTLAENVSAEAHAANDLAIAAQKDATSAIATANGKNMITWAKSEPPGGTAVNRDGRNVLILDGTAVSGRMPVDGDMWYVRSSSNYYEVLRMYRFHKDLKDVPEWNTYSGRSGWVIAQNGSDTILSLSAGKITSGTLQASTSIRVGDLVGFLPNGSIGLTPYMEIGRSSLQVFRPVDDPADSYSTHTTTVTLGGATNDQLMIYNTEGQALAGFDQEGNATANLGAFNYLTLDGDSFGDLSNPEDKLAVLPRGRVATFVFPSANYPQASSTLGVGEVSWFMEENRMYKISFDGQINGGANSSTFRLFLYYIGSTGPDRPAGQITINNSRQIAMGFFSTGQNYGVARAHIEAHVGIGAPAREGKVLLALQRITGGYPSLYWDGQATLYVDDIGVYPGADGGVYGKDGQLNTGGGIVYAGGDATTNVTPTSTTRTYTKTYNASWSQSYRGSNAAMGTSEVRQGSSSNYGQMRAAIGFPSQVQSDLNGATIQKIEVYLYANHWYFNDGGTATIGTHTASSSPSTFPGNNTVVTTRKWSTKTGGQWITLPSSVHQYWVSGNNKGITVGVGAGSSNSYYGRFDGYGMSHSPKLRVTYSK